MLPQTLKRHNSAVSSVVFSPDSRLTLAKRLSILPQTLKRHSNLVRSIAFSPNSRLLASASTNKTVWLWDTVTSVLQQTLKRHSD
jgi:WD40 repeat protein